MWRKLIFALANKKFKNALINYLVILSMFGYFCHLFELRSLK